MSASPAPSDAEAPRDQEQITFRFCRECSNMLYPKEDRENNQLMYACRTCQFSEPAVTACVYRNQLTNTVGETAGVTQDVGSDPTVGDLFFDDFDINTGPISNIISSILAEEAAEAAEAAEPTFSSVLPLCLLCGEEITSPAYDSGVDMDYSKDYMSDSDDSADHLDDSIAGSNDSNTSRNPV